MKKFVFVLVCFIMAEGAFSQNLNNSEIPNSLVWFGLDFSHTKLVGTSKDFSDLDKIISYYFKSWNDLIIIENKKYDLKKAYHVKDVKYDIEPAIKRSQQNSSKDILVLNSQSLTKADIKAIINDCSFKGNSKTGLIYIVESLNKIEKKATVVVTIFDIKTKEIIFQKRISGNARGFGFRNYWMGSFYDILKRSGESY